MFSMAVLSLVFLFSLVSSVRGQLVAGTKQDFFECGRFQCINETGVTCHNDKWCRCPPGQIGDARIECVEPDGNCLCTLGGDPHLVTFAGDLFTLPLPCGHTLHDRKIESGCLIAIAGRAVYNGTNPRPYAAFESNMNIRVSTGVVYYTVEIVRNQAPVTAILDEGGNVASNPDFEVREFIGDGFFSAEIPKCDVTIKYSDDKAFFSLLTSSGDGDVEYATPGLCGECGNSRPNPPLALDLFQALEIQLLASEGNHINRDDNDVYPACRDLRGLYQSCPADRKEFVIKFCGSLLLEETRDCFFGLRGNVEKVLEVFTSCVQAVCRKDPCSTYPNMFEVCAFAGVESYLSDETFCSSR